MSIRMRHTRGHSGNRRSHHALKQTNIVKDAASGALRLPHRLDETTGMYRGKLIAAPKAARAPRGDKTHGPDTSPAPEHKHEHAHVAHENATKPKTSKGIIGKLTGGAKPKARSGAGGGGV